MSLSNSSQSLVYLSDYCDLMDSLPVELSRCFTRLKELDALAFESNQTLKQATMSFIQHQKSLTKQQRTVELQRIASLAKQNMKFGQQKVALSTWTFDMVDQHVKRCDEDLTKFEEEQLAGMQSMAPSYEKETPKRKRRQAIDNRERIVDSPMRESSAGPSNGRPRRSRTSQSRIREQQQQQQFEDFDVEDEEAFLHSIEDKEDPVDDNEPTYCICSQVSFGEMIACDNDDCPIEWFHYTCVGLDGPVKGKWYCPSCQKSLQEKQDMLS